MKLIANILFTILMTGVCMAEDRLPEVTGEGNWGKAQNGLSCRITTNKKEYAIGETVYVLVEVKNETDSAITLGIEPLIEIGKEKELSRQPAQLHISFTQQNNGRLGFFLTYHKVFPFGDKFQAKAVVVKPEDVYSELREFEPWGPAYIALPAEAEPGKMKIEASLRQFLTPDLKVKIINFDQLTINIK